jgi:bifunctional enzyme CysN/CysC
MSTASRQRLSVVIAGHVDHGKSTVIGRLLADTGSLPDGKLEQIRALCERTGRPFEYAFLLDALKDERAQGITIDTARVFFRTAAREYLLLDAPGHVEFIRNLVTGASRADAAVLIVDAALGVQDNSRRHGYLLGLLGIRQVVVVVNKMDLVGYDESAFRRLVAEYAGILGGAGLTPAHWIPVSAREGDNLTVPSPQLAWYDGPTLLEALERLPAPADPVEGPFRMPVQDVYKFTGRGDDRRIVAGTVESGTLRPGDELVFYPSGKRARVRSLEAFAEDPPAGAGAGEAIGFTLEEQIYITRGELAARAADPPPAVGARLRVGLFWLGREPLRPGREYQLKLGTARASMRVESIQRALDASSLAVTTAPAHVGRHEIAECTLQLGRAIAADSGADLAATSRFVILDGHDIAGGGLVREALPDPQAPRRDAVMRRNAKWETSFIPVERRAQRYHQQPTLLLLTGSPEADRKRLAKALEARLFAEGQVVYYLGMASMLYGVDADLGRGAPERAEHLRRLAEVANLMLDAGMILVVTAAELTRDEVAGIATAIAPDRVVTAWLGDRVTTDLRADLELDEAAAGRSGVERLRELLAERGAFHPAEAAVAPLLPVSVIWLTGLSGAGKSTVADWVAAELQRRGYPVERLDGDAMRQVFPEIGFSREARDQQVRRAGYLAARLEANGVFVVASFISPYRDSRRFVRSLCRSFVEVYVNTPLAVCEARDSKGLYRKARAGEITQFTGISDPYEEPESAEVSVDGGALAPDEAGRRILAFLEARAGSA